MNRWVKFSAIMLVILCLCLVATGMNALADVGNFNSYDSGSDYSSSYDSGSDYSYDWDFSDSSSSGGDGDIGFLTYVIAAAIVLWVILPKNAKSKISNSFNNAASNLPSAGVTDMTQSIETQIREHDPDFSSQKFLSWAEEVFITLQDAWTKRDWKIIRPFECEALFNKHSKQLDEYIRNNTINVVERVCVNKSMLTQYSQDNNYEYVTVYMKTRMNDYIIDATTRQVVKGDPNREFFTNYNLKFMRSLGVKTTVNSGKSTTNCPNCGAPTQITSAGECEYCNSVITTGQHDWVLCDLDSAQ